MKKRFLATFMAAVTAATMLASTIASADTKKITISVPDPEASYIYQAAQEFANRATEYSDGTLEFTISGNGSLYGSIPVLLAKMVVFVALFVVAVIADQVRQWLWSLIQSRFFSAGTHN